MWLPYSGQSSRLPPQLWTTSSTLFLLTCAAAASKAWTSWQIQDIHLWATATETVMPADPTLWVTGSEAHGKACSLTTPVRTTLLLKPAPPDFHHQPTPDVSKHGDTSATTN